MKLRIIQKYKNLPMEIKATLWFLVCSVLQNGISFLTTPVFTRIMTKEQFGQYSLYLSWLSFIEIFTTLMLWGGSFNKAMLDFENERKRYISALQGLTTSITIAVFGLYMLLGKDAISLFGMDVPIMLCMFVQLIFLPSFQFWAQCQKFEYKYRYYVLYSLLLAVVTPIIAIIAVDGSTNKGEMRIFATVAVETVFNIGFYIYNFAKGKHFFNKNYWKYALSFNFVLIPHYIANSILSQADRIMIGYFCTEEQIGIYSLIYNVAMVLQIVTNSIGASLTPWIYRKIQNNKPQEVRRMAIYLQSGFMFLILIISMFAPEIVYFMGGEEYMEGVYIFTPVMCSSFCIFTTVIINAFEYYYAAKKEILVATIVSALCNIGLNLIFIPRYGYIGAAYTTLASYVLFEILHIVFLNIINKRNGIRKSYFNSIVLILQTVILVMMTGIMNMMYSYSLLRYLLIGIGVGILFLCRNKIKTIIMSLKEK